MANSASKAALDIVGGFMNRREERRERRENRHERRESRKELRKESRRGGGQEEASTSSSTQVPHQPYKPQYGSASSASGGSASGSSVSGHNASEGSNMRGQRNTTSDYDSNNERELEIIKTNAPLELNESWSGSSCHLKTTNGHLTVHGSLSATDNILLENSNGNVVVEGQLLASHTICVKASNGIFVVRGESIIANYVDVQISNSPLQINSFIQAARISLKTKNAPVNLGNISLGTELIVKTSNSPIDIHVLDIASGSAKIHVESSNAPVNVYVPSSFSGYFSVKSNSTGSANIVAKSTEQSLLQFDVNEQSKKEGSCKNLGNKSNIEIEIRTSNATATLYI